MKKKKYPKKKEQDNIRKLLQNIKSNLKRLYKNRKLIKTTYDPFGIPSEERLAGYPEIGDVLIQEPSNYSSLSILNRGSRDMHNIYYCEGFYSASIIIAKRLLTTKDVGEKDSFIYPVLFLFRQYLELIMKDIIHNYKIANSEITEEQCGFESVHHLETAWKEVKKYLPNVEEERHTVAAVEKIIKECDTVIDAFNTRYPYKVGKTPQSKIKDSFDKAYRVDVKNMYNVMLKLRNYFEDISNLSYVALDKFYIEKNLHQKQIGSNK